MLKSGKELKVFAVKDGELQKFCEEAKKYGVGNCDEFLYLGGNEQSTHEYVSKLLGKETIDTNTYGRARGRNGSYTTNWQITGRELMTPDEVRKLDNQYALRICSAAGCCGSARIHRNCLWRLTRSDAEKWRDDYGSKDKPRDP